VGTKQLGGSLTRKALAEATCQIKVPTKLNFLLFGEFRHEPEIIFSTGIPTIMTENRIQLVPIPTGTGIEVERLYFDWRF